MKTFIKSLAVGITTAAFATATLAASVTVSGSTTVASAVMLPMEQQIEASAGVEMEIIANGSSRGIADLVAGTSTMAMISAPIDVTVAKINKKDPALLQGVDLVGHQIGETVVAFTVHPSNPVSSLTLDQLSSVLDGSITNWSQLGGPNMPIIVVAETSGGGVRSLTEDQLLDGASISAQLREFPNATQVPTVTQQLPPALGISGAAAAKNAGARVLETDVAISQPLILVTIGEPAADAASLIAAAREHGS